MRCGPMMTASPRKSMVQPPPIGSPRLARNSIATKDGGARLSAIGRIALRDKPSQQQHSAAIYGWTLAFLFAFSPRTSGFQVLVVAVCGLAFWTRTGTNENSPSRPQSDRGLPASRSSSAPRQVALGGLPSFFLLHNFRCPSTQRGSSLPREPNEGRGPPQRAASSIDCSSFDRAGNCPVPSSSLPSRSAFPKNMLGSSYGPGPLKHEDWTMWLLVCCAFAGIEESYGRKVDLVSPNGQSAPFPASLVQTVESLLQGKLSQPPNGLLAQLDGRPCCLPRMLLPAGQRRAMSKINSISGQLQRDVSLPTMVDDLVLYTEPQDDLDQKPGLGAVQPKGRAEVMQQWLRELPQALVVRRSGPCSFETHRPQMWLQRWSGVACQMPRDKPSANGWQAISEDGIACWSWNKVAPKLCCHRILRLPCSPTFGVVLF
eukprot:g12745.t1